MNDSWIKSNLVCHGAFAIMGMEEEEIGRIKCRGREKGL